LILNLLFLNLAYSKKTIAEVAYEPKYKGFGKFSVSIEGKICGVRIEHIQGYVTCIEPEKDTWSYWSCHISSMSSNFVTTVITDSSNKPLFPENYHSIRENNGGFDYPGVTDRSEVLEFAFDPSKCISVSKGQELRIWYGEDLVGWGEDDNRGRHLVRITGLYQE